MQGPLFRLSEDAPVIAFTGRAPGADTDAVLGELGYTPGEIADLRAEGSIA
jgi:crotonobetainyl-CoA:carnitine CoA-transferase CaiB-like acyl-CoA transferase